MNKVWRFGKIVAVLAVVVFFGVFLWGPRCYDWLDNQALLANNCSVDLYTSNLVSLDSLTFISHTITPIQLNQIPSWIDVVSGDRKVRDQSFWIHFTELSYTPAANERHFYINTGNPDEMLEDFLTAISYDSLLAKHKIAKSDILLGEAQIRARAWAAAINRLSYSQYKAQNPDILVSPEFYDMMVAEAKRLLPPIALVQNK